MRHFFSGFIVEFTGQLKAWANSGLFTSAPITLQTKPVNLICMTLYSLPTLPPLLPSFPLLPHFPSFPLLLPSLLLSSLSSLPLLTDKDQGYGGHF